MVPKELQKMWRKAGMTVGKQNCTNTTTTPQQITNTLGWPDKHQLSIMDYVLSELGIDCSSLKIQKLLTIFGPDE